MLERMLEVKQALKETVADPKWEAWCEAHPEHEETADFVHDKVGSNLWWRDAEQLVDLLRYALLLRFRQL